MKVCDAATKRSAAPFRAAAERSEQAQFRFAGNIGGAPEPWRRRTRNGVCLFTAEGPCSARGQRRPQADERRVRERNRMAETQCESRAAPGNA